MNDIANQPAIPGNLDLLRETGYSDPGDEQRPNRMCVCFSDVHFTDGTVGRQSAEDVVWEEVFDNIMDMCVDKEIEELTLVLAGDVADLIRTALWTKCGVYPWQRDDPKFKMVLRKIMRGIIDIHTKPSTLDGNAGFFYLLKDFDNRFQQYSRANNKNDFVPATKKAIKIQTVVLLGNHDKELCADDETLKMFYEECLGQKVDTLSIEYRRWIGKMYFGDENRFLDPNSAPWLPFYWGDSGFRFFVTHGQWRDVDNSRRIEASVNPGWQVKDGWQLEAWRKLQYKPFTEACFGDTVAAGVLSGFIYRAKAELADIEATLHRKGMMTAEMDQELHRLKQILDELDLYRPSAAAVKRIIVETRRLRNKGAGYANVRTMIEKELLASIHAWLGWDFTLASAAPSRRWLLRIAKPLVGIIKLLGARFELEFIYGVMSLLAKLQEWDRDAPSYQEMLRFPAFLPDYRNYGFRIHGEGHTHIPLQEELDFNEPKDRRNYTYINFGAWRDQIVPKAQRGYRRRGVGRALTILDLVPAGGQKERRFNYWVEDILSWGDRMDSL